MANGFQFPSQLWVLINDEDVPVNLIFVTEFGAWVREDAEWTEFLIDDSNPKRQFEDMQIASVDPRIIDIWDLGNVTEDVVEEFEYKWAPPEPDEAPEAEAEADEETDEETDEEAVTAAVYEVNSGLSSALKRLVADNITAYHHAQGYHWNVKGKDFAQYHALFLTIYEDYLAAIDPTAENLLKIGDSAPYTQQDIDRHRSIPDVPAAETPQEMAASLLAINDALRESTKAAFDEAANADQQGMVDFLGGRLDILDKWSWQLRSSVA